MKERLCIFFVALLITCYGVQAQGTLAGQIMGFDIQNFPGSINARLFVYSSGVPLTNLDETNFSVRELVRTSVGVDTFNISKNNVFTVYQPVGASDPYIIRYKPEWWGYDGLQRTVEVIVSNNGEAVKLSGSYSPGSYPVIIRTDNTLDLHQSTLLNNMPVTLEVEVRDILSTYSTNRVTLFHRRSGSSASYAPLGMVKSGVIPGVPARSIWKVTIPASEVSTPGIEYYVSATNANTTTNIDYSTTTIPEFIDRPGYPYTLAVLPAVPPSVTHTPITTTADPKQPITFSATASDVYGIDSVVLSVSLDDGLTYSESSMSPTGNNVYVYTLPPIGGAGRILHYYIRAVNVLGATTFVGSPTNSYSIVVGVPWTLTPTPVIQTVRFIRNVLPNGATVTINGVPAANGDVIAAFYDAGNGVYRPAGKVTWASAASLNSMVVYGDAPGGVKDGFADGEVLTFKVYQKSTGEIYEADHVAYPLPGSQITFSSGKFSMVKELIAYPEQIITLPLGKSLWSTNLIPISPAFADLLAPVASQVRLVSDAEGNSYTPGTTSAGLTTYVSGYGYLAEMNAPATLRIRGSRPTGNPTVNLSNSGVFVGTPYRAAQNVEHVFPPSDPSVYIVDRYVTQPSGVVTVETYSPLLGFNGWSDKNMQPGQAYYVSSQGVRAFTFPAYTGAYPNREAVTATAQPNPQTIASISRYMRVFIPAEAYENITEGTEIRVYSATNTLAGNALVGPRGALIAIDGTLLADGERFTLRTLEEKDAEEKALIVDHWKMGGNVYRNHDLAVSGSAWEVSLSAEEIRFDVFPNPVNTGGTITFYNGLDQEVSIGLYDIQGKNVQTIAHGRFEKGVHAVNVYTQGLLPGVYVVKKTAGRSVETQRIIIK